MEQPLVHESATSAPATGTKKHNPILCALSHVLIFAGVYLYLRLYKRFFIALGAMVLVRFLPVSYLSFFLLIVAMVDTYQQTTLINEGKIQKEPFDQTKHVGGILLLIAVIVLSMVGYGSFGVWR